MQILPDFFTETIAEHGETAIANMEPHYAENTVLQKFQRHVVSNQQKQKIS